MEEDKALDLGRALSTEVDRIEDSIGPTALCFTGLLCGHSAAGLRGGGLLMCFKGQHFQMDCAPGSSISVTIDRAGPEPLGQRLWGEMCFQATDPLEAGQSDHRCCLTDQLQNVHRKRGFSRNTSAEIQPTLHMSPGIAYVDYRGIPGAWSWRVATAGVRTIC